MRFILISVSRGCLLWISGFYYGVLSNGSKRTGNFVCTRRIGLFWWIMHANITCTISSFAITLLSLMFLLPKRNERKEHSYPTCWYCLAKLWVSWSDLHISRMHQSAQHPLHARPNPCLFVGWYNCSFGYCSNCGCTSLIQCYNIIVSECCKGNYFTFFHTLVHRDQRDLLA